MEFTDDHHCGGIVFSEHLVLTVTPKNQQHKSPYYFITVQSKETKLCMYENNLLEG